MRCGVMHLGWAAVAAWVALPLWAALTQLGLFPPGGHGVLLPFVIVALAMLQWGFGVGEDSFVIRWTPWVLLLLLVVLQQPALATPGMIAAIALGLLNLACAAFRFKEEMHPEA